MKLYVYRYLDVDGPTWEPLRWAAARSKTLSGTPTLDPDDFMYGGHRPAGCSRTESAQSRRVVAT